MKIWWCQEHEARGVQSGCQYSTVAQMEDCRMVPMRLIPDKPGLEEIPDPCDPPCGWTHWAPIAALDGETP